MSLLTSLVFLAIAAVPPVATIVPACAMSADDAAWTRASLAAWDHVSTRRLALPPHHPPTIVFFDATCRFEATGTSGAWTATQHHGKVGVPGGGELPAQVTSFAGQDEKTGREFFVMALPSVWQEAKVPIAEDPRGLTSVFLHEFSHTRQMLPLKAPFERAEAVRKMGDDFNDDSLQNHFEPDPIYVAVVEKEIDLLFRAAAEPDVGKARALAAQALALADARQKRWFIGEEAYWRPYDDLFLTMEGFGQWVAYAWLVDPAGGKMDEASARHMVRNTRWWTQTQGFALFLVIDRFVPDWSRRAFADQPALGIDLLRLAVEKAP